MTMICRQNDYRKGGVCALLLLSSLLLQACAIGNAKTAHNTFDPTITTSSLNATSANGTDDSLLRDQQAVRERVVALTGVDGSLAGGSFDWENNETGSRGTISALREEKEEGRRCHSFKTTREAFDGVMVYDGKICERAEGIWALNAFNTQ